MASSVKVLESRFVQSCTSIANAPQISHAEIAILGRSNVGKSSLINALLNNKNLAKSSGTPGKTRLVNLFISKWQYNSLNSPLGAPCGDFGNLGRFADAKVQSHAPNSQKTSQFPPQMLELDSNKRDSSESNDSSLRENERSEFSWQSKQNKCASAHRISPDSWCKKSESKGAVVPPADFLLESELRGSPPKSEKAAAFWRIGGAGRGVQPFLREKTSESNGKSVDCFGDESPRNDESFLNCHDSPKSPQDEFAQEFAIHILDFPGFGYAKVSKSERDSWDKNLSTFLKKRESIKLFIHLIDSRHTNLPLDDEIRAFLRSNLRADADILEVFTKADKLKKSEIHALKGRILVSTTKKDLGQKDSKDNIESLRHAILRTMYHI